MIRSFEDRDTRRFFEGKRIRGFTGFKDRAFRRLLILHRATSLQDLARLPSTRLEAMSRNRIGQYSFRINQKMRICFRRVDDRPYDVEIVDYH